MAKLQIITEPNDFLRRRSKPVTDFGPRLHVLLGDMRDTMTAAAGVGIAAVQVGALYRAALVETAADGIVELINPEIVESANPKVNDEACLSVPRGRGNVMRPQYVRVASVDRNGNPQMHEFKGREAVCACHEIDHMDGVLFIDKVIK
jgi:peptide deformylase